MICRPLLEFDQEEANRNAELILSPNTASKLDYDLTQYLQMIYAQSIEEYVSEQEQEAVSEKQETNPSDQQEDL